MQFSAGILVDMSFHATDSVLKIVQSCAGAWVMLLSCAGALMTIQCVRVETYFNVLA